MKILVVDDDSAVLNFLKQCFGFFQKDEKTVPSDVSFRVPPILVHKPLEHLRLNKNTRILGKFNNHFKGQLKNGECPIGFKRPFKDHFRQRMQ